MTKQTLEQVLERVRSSYESVHKKSPIITNYLSSAVGTVGGDALAKQFTNSPEVSLRDIIFTGTAAIAYSYLAPKMIEWSTKLTDRLSDFCSELQMTKFAHTLTNTVIVTGMYLPVNMVYWNILTIKNEAPITLDDNLTGLITLGVASIPYLVADYIAIKKFTQPETKKWLRPFYSGVELGWNALFAGGNYLAKKY